MEDSAYVKALRDADKAIECVYNEITKKHSLHFTADEVVVLKMLKNRIDTINDMVQFVQRNKNELCSSAGKSPLIN